jgi:AcrR family transcriptional regulator
VRQIARLLQRREASLYAHVASKEELLAAIVDRAAARFQAVVDAALAREAPAADRLREIVRGHVAVITEDPAAAAVYLSEWRHLTGERRQLVLARRDAYEAAVRRVVAQGIAEGAFRPVDVAGAVRALLCALNGVASWYRADGPAGAGEIANLHADLFLHGLVAEGSANGRGQDPRRKDP